MKNLLYILLITIFTSCGDYGTLLEFNGGELYYTSSISEREAYRLGEFLVDNEFFDGEGKTVQINKSGNTYEFRMVVKKGIEKDEEFIQVFKNLSAVLSEDVFDGYSVDIHLCDVYINTLRVVVPLPI